MGLSSGSGSSRSEPGLTVSGPGLGLFLLPSSAGSRRGGFTEMELRLRQATIGREGLGLDFGTD